MTPGNRRQAHSAFTLIELLVAVSIIAILAALLLPALSRAKATAKGSQCMSNLRQMAQVMTMYADEYDSTMPWVKKNGQEGYPQKLIGEMTGRQTREDFIGVCPEDGRSHDPPSVGNPAKYLQGGWWSGNWGNWSTSSYTCNTYVFAWEGTPLVRASRLGRPEITFLFADGNRNFCNSWNQYFYTLHNEGINLCFLDGHVEYKSLGYPNRTTCGYASTPFQYPFKPPANSRQYPWR